MRSPRNLTLTRMELTHLREVVEIELASFESPWSEDAWRAELAYHDSLCYVALDAGGVVVGMVALRRMVDEGHVLKLAVRPDLRRQGIATALVRMGLEALKRAGCARVCLELRSSNHAAAAFYKKFGFSMVGLRAAYYREPVEDAVVMCRGL